MCHHFWRENRGTATLTSAEAVQHWPHSHWAASVADESHRLCWINTPTHLMIWGNAWERHSYCLKAAGEHGNGIPIVKMFKNAHKLAVHVCEPFSGQNALDCNLNIVPKVIRDPRRLQTSWCLNSPISASLASVPIVYETTMSQLAEDYDFSTVANTTATCRVCFLHKHLTQTWHVYRPMMCGMTYSAISCWLRFWDSIMSLYFLLVQLYFMCNSWCVYLHICSSGTY